MSHSLLCLYRSFGLSICKSWSSKVNFTQVPPEMDRHLGFLEIPQPVNNNIEVIPSFFLFSHNNYIYHTTCKVRQKCWLLTRIQMCNPPQIYASGKHVKFTRSFTGDASDWLYRKEVKSLMDDIIVTLLSRKLLLIFLLGKWNRWYYGFWQLHDWNGRSHETFRVL